MEPTKPGRYCWYWDREGRFRSCAEKERLSAVKVEPRCSACVWWLNGGSTCHRHAPSPITIHSDGVGCIGLWPEVHFDDWCGEFTPKETP